MSDPLDHTQPFDMADIPTTDIKVGRPGDPDYLSHLPPELLRLVLQQLLPQGLVFEFKDNSERVQSEDFHSQWSLVARPIGRSSRVAFDLRWWNICKFCDRVVEYIEPCPCGLMNNSIYYVSRKIASEARAVFFSGNVFRFLLDEGLSQYPRTKPSKLFGPLEQRYQKNVLRELQRVQLDLEEIYETFDGVRRRRTQLQHVVNMLGNHNENTAKALLRSLEVRVSHSSPFQSGKVDKSMFALEVLSDLKGLTKVKFEGIPSWFSDCLVLQLTGKGGPSVYALSWPTKMKKHKRKQKSVTSREYWQPTLDWKEYAMRNGIELPADVDIYFPPSQ